MLTPAFAGPLDHRERRILLPGFEPREIAAADPRPFGERNLAQSSDGPQPP